MLPSKHNNRTPPEREASILYCHLLGRGPREKSNKRTMSTLVLMKNGCNSLRRGLDSGVVGGSSLLNYTSSNVLQRLGKLIDRVLLLSEMVRSNRLWRTILSKSLPLPVRHWMFLDVGNWFLFNVIWLRELGAVAELVLFASLVLRLVRHHQLCDRLRGQVEWARLLFLSAFNYVPLGTFDWEEEREKEREQKSAS